MCLKFTNCLLVAVQLACKQCVEGVFSDIQWRLAQQQAIETEGYPEQHCDPYCLKVMLFDPQYLVRGPPTSRWQGPDDLTKLEQTGATVSWDGLFIKYSLPAQFSKEAVMSVPATPGNIFRGCGCNVTQITFIEPMFQCWDCMFWYMRRTGDCGFKETPFCVKAHQCPEDAASAKYKWPGLGSLSDNPGWEPPRNTSCRGARDSRAQDKTFPLTVGIVVAAMVRSIA